MKIQTLLGSTMMMILGFASCESHEKKVDDAFDLVKESKIGAKDTIQIRTVKVLVKNHRVDEWALYRADMERKMKATESRIQALKERKDLPGSKAKLDKEIARLEQKNKDHVPARGHDKDLVPVSPLLLYQMVCY